MAWAYVDGSRWSFDVLLGSDGRPVDAVGDFVEAAGVAEVVIVAVAPPQWRCDRPAVGALAPLQQRRVVCTPHTINHITIMD